MSVRRSIVVFAALLTAALASSVTAEDTCNAAADKCALQIRQMLSGRRWLGIDIVDLKPGLVVKSVLPSSPARRANLMAGDRLVAVNGASTLETTPGDFKKLIATASQTGRLWMIVQRRGALKKVELRLEPYPKEQVDKIIASHLTRGHSATVGSDH